MFDYIFYRLANFFYRDDGNMAIRALAILSLTQGLFIIDITFLMLRFTYSSFIIAKYAKFSGQACAILLGLIIILNYLRYRDKFSHFQKKWGDSPTFLQNLSIWVSLLLPWILLYVITTLPKV